MSKTKKIKKIPKTLSRWLKDNNHYIEFIRLIKVCGYSVKELCWIDVNGNYGIIDWLKLPNTTIGKNVFISKTGETMAYSDFLKEYR